ncbi:MAG: heavy-metal-associated domain-containing protein [Anaerolineales bacterium]
METITLAVPKMYADHHVMAVRAALAEVDGIEQILASAAWKQIEIGFDSDKTAAEDIQAALEGAGYPVGVSLPAPLVERDSIGRDPQWAELDLRVTKTNKSDLEMTRQFHGR